MTIEKLQAQVAELSVLALADTPGLDGYYASRYSGEQIDNLLSGLGFEIGGSYANLAAIQAAFPNGDTHAYQAKDTMDIYVWNAKTRAWESVGKLQGAVGPKGDKGDPGGPPGPQGERGPGSNPNLLDNWYFLDPINQRGLQEYNTGGYTIDRWKLIGNTGIKLQVQGDGLVITSPNKFGCYFLQILDQNIVSAIRGKTVTISKLTTENSGLFSIMMYSNNTWLGGSGNEDGLVTATIQIPEDTQNLIFQVGANVAGTTKIEAVKLELGTEQTLARQDADGNWVLNDPPPNYALELLKCQRYFERAHWNISLAVASSASEIRFCSTYYFKTPKRTSPSIVPSTPLAGQILMAWDTVEHTDITGLEHTTPIAWNTGMFSPRVIDPQNRFVTDRIYQVLIPDYAYDISADL